MACHNLARVDKLEDEWTPMAQHSHINILATTPVQEHVVSPKNLLLNLIADQALH